MGEVEKKASRRKRGGMLQRNGIFPRAVTWRRALAVAGTWAFLGKMVTAGGGALIFILLARLLEPKSMGAYFLAFSIVTVLGMLSRIGLDKTVLRVVANNLAVGDYSELRSGLLQIYVIASCVATVVALFLLFGGGQWIAVRLFHSTALERARFLLVPWMVAATFETLFAETFRGFNDIPKASAFGGALSRTLCVVGLAICCLAWRQIGLEVAIILTLLGYCVSIIWAAIELIKLVSESPRTTRRSVRSERVMRTTWPLLISNLAIFLIAQAGFWILGTVSSSTDVAVFGMCVRLVMLVGVLFVVAASILPPIIGRLYSEGRIKQLGEVMRGVAATVAIPSCAVLAIFVFFGKSVLSLAFGKFYGSGGEILAILSIGQIANVFVGDCGTLLIMSGHQRDLMAMSLVGCAVAVGGGIQLSAMFGAIGMALATAAGTITLQFGMLIAARRRCGIWTYVNFADMWTLIRGV